MESDKTITALRQKAGCLVIECRAIVPKRSRYDTATERDMKNRIIKGVQRCAVNRSLVNRMQLYLAMLGWDAWENVLTFAEEPNNYKEVQKAICSFLQRIKRWRNGQPLDWVLVIEAVHGDGRYHIHFCCRYGDLSPEEVRHLWVYGIVLQDDPIIKNDEWFYRMARYLTKEGSDGVKLPVGRHPISVSASLRNKLPKHEKWEAESADFEMPSGAIEVNQSGWEANISGMYRYFTYIVPDKTFQCQRACARARVPYSCNVVVID